MFGLRTDPYISVRRPANLGREVTHTGPWAWSDTIAGWTWPGFEGTTVPVEVYSDADEVELLLDGDRSVGSRPAQPTDFRADFEVAYAPGELVAVAYRDGVESGRTALRTAVGPLRLVAAADRDEIDATDTDLAYVSVCLADESGVIVTDG